MLLYIVTVLSHSYPHNLVTFRSEISVMSMDGSRSMATCSDLPHSPSYSHHSSGQGASWQWSCLAASLPLSSVTSTLSESSHTHTHTLSLLFFAPHISLPSSPPPSDVGPCSAQLSFSMLPPHQSTDMSGEPSSQDWGVSVSISCLDIIL